MLHVQGACFCSEHSSKWRVPSHEQVNRQLLAGNQWALQLPHICAGHICSWRHSHRYCQCSGPFGRSCRRSSVSPQCSLRCCARYTACLCMHSLCCLSWLHADTYARSISIARSQLDNANWLYCFSEGGYPYFKDVEVHQPKCAAQLVAAALHASVLLGKLDVYDCASNQQGLN